MTKRFWKWIPLFLLMGMADLMADSYWFRTRTSEWKKSGKTAFLAGKVQAVVLDSLDAIYEKSPYDYTFYTKGEELFVLVSCTFDLYKINGASLEKQYQYFNRGFTCGTSPILRDNVHYLIGGKGFWTSQMDLLSFDELHGSWEWVKTYNQPTDYFSPYVYQNSKGIFSLFGYYYNPRKGVDYWETQGYFLDWESKSWKKISIQIEGVDNNELVSKSAISTIETESYLLLLNTSGKENLGWNVLDKESGKIFYFLSRNADMVHSPVLEIIENRLFYQSESGDSRSLDLDSIKGKSVEVGEVRILDDSIVPGEVTQSATFLFLLLAFGLGGAFVWVYLTRRKVMTPILVPVKGADTTLANFNFPPAEVLLPYDGQQLTTEIIDQLLGLEHLENFDFKRMKRSRLIKEINKRYVEHTGRELVFRDKKPDDRRFTYYKIKA